MASSKRRRLDITQSPQPPAMSAFALRKRLLSAHTASSPAASNITAEQPVKGDVVLPSLSTESQTQDKARPRRSKRTRLPRTPSTQENHPAPDSKELAQAAPATEKGLPPDTASPLPAESSPAIGHYETPIEPPPVLFSNFKPSKSNYQKRKDGRLHLKLVDGERLVVLGSYGISVSSGASTLRDLGKLSPYFRRLWNETPESDSSFTILYTSADGPKRALLQDLISPAEWNKEISRLVSKSASKPISVMVTGPKSAGKSTFGKLLVNRLVTYSPKGTKNKRIPDVAVLDLDPGQQEYGVPGQISLARLGKPVLQPSFCRPLSGTGFKIIRSHSLASISPASDPDLYIDAARDLATHYRNVLGTCPLIINTPGWIQGTGLDLLISLITDLRPAEVIYMSQTGPAEATTQYTSRTAAHLRAMQTMSYFHAEAEVDQSLTKWNTNPLTTVPPWLVSYAGESRGILGIMLYDYQTSQDLLADAINGTVLAAVEVESALAFRDLVDQKTEAKGSDDDIRDADTRMDVDDDDDNDDPKPTTTPSLDELQKRLTVPTPEGIPLISATHGTTLDPRYSRFLGLVLMRGLDVRNKALQLLTPIAAERIDEVSARGGEIVLVSGRFDPPSWAYTEDLYYRRSRAEDDNGDGVSGDEGVDDEDEPMEVVEDGGTENDSASEAEDAGSGLDTVATPTPWIEILRGNQKRGAGSKVWRVRRDLGRGGNGADPQGPSSPAISRRDRSMVSTCVNRSPPPPPPPRDDLVDDDGRSCACSTARTDAAPTNRRYPPPRNPTPGPSRRRPAP
ncbi:hypothetical protein DL769_003904 [Monosporascus sp. CRB-8-3]|nr:hypothetical protein DL769_003904 [Monosporascus sp. CRB-8-3]